MTRNICRQFFRSAAALAVIAAASVPASAQLRHSEAETASEINAANKLLRDGKVDEALQAFRRVVPGDQQRVELNYNMAVAEYRKGNTEAAEKLFSEVAGTTTPAVASNSRYNLGNCQYAKALQVADQDKPAAIEHLRDAISHYRGALRGNPNNADARANIELAGELIRKLEQEQKEQEEQKQQDQQQPQDDKQPRDGQKNEDQQNQKDQSGQKSDQQKKDGEKNDTPGDEQQKSDEQKSDEQKSPGEETQPDQPKPSEQQQQQQEQKGSDNNQTQPQDRQQQSGDQQQPNDETPSEDQKAQNKTVPEGDLKAAGQQGENNKPDGGEAMAEPIAKDGLMTREEALKMLQSVRDRDMLRRMQQQRKERSRHVPVDRDW